MTWTPDGPDDRHRRWNEGWDRDLALALAFLTRLPVRTAGGDGALGPAMRAFPLVGALVGLAGGLVCLLMDALGLPPPLSAPLAVLAVVLLTGALHEDGLADTADGLGGGRSPNARLAIMRDSRTGAFGVVALVLSLFMRVAAVALLVQGEAAIAGLVAAHAAGRAVLAPLHRRLPPARRDGLGAAAGRPDARAEATALALGLLACVLMLGLWHGILAMAAALAAAWVVGWLARRLIGGQTGDVSGAAEQLAEIAVLLVAVATLAG